jgi:hypothetical protein
MRERSQDGFGQDAGHKQRDKAAMLERWKREREKDKEPGR